MRIVFLHHANVCQGGIERMLAVRANWLTEHYQCEVTFLTYEQNGEPFPYLLSPKIECYDLGIRLYAAYQSPYPIRFFRKRQLRKQLQDSLTSFLDQKKPDIVICTDKDSYEQMALIRASHQSATTPKLVIEAHVGMIDHQYQVYRTESLFKKLFALIDLQKLKRAVSHFDYLIALTQDDAYCWNPYIKTIVIPNILPYYPERVDEKASKYRRVISVGRLDYQKGQDLLLRAWQKVESIHPEWHLDIYGSGKEKLYLETLIKELQLKNVHIRPTTHNIYHEYLTSDFLVCTSRWESFGLVLIEAMACALPVVAFDCNNGPRNIVKHQQTGLLVENGNVESMSDGISWMIENDEKRRSMGCNARHSIAPYKIENVMPMFLKLYEQMID